MHVLHLITSLNPGGIERFILGLLSQIPRDACTMDICCKEQAGRWAPRAEALGARIYVSKLRPSHLGFGRDLRRILINGKYDILHSHLGSYSAFPVWIAHRLGIPVVTTFHSTVFPPQVSWLKWPGLREIRALYSRLSIDYALKNSDFIVGVSQGVIDALMPEQHPSRARTRVIRHGVLVPGIPDEEEKRLFRRSLGWSEDVKVVIHVGRFHPQKNHEAAVRIFSAVRQAVPSARMVFVGDGELRRHIEVMVRSQGLDADIRFLGIRDNVQEIMSLCDLFLFPSLHEGFGIVAIEASAAGLPVVASRIPGVIEAVKDGVSGVLCTLGDDEDMARQVHRFLENPTLAREMGQNGRKWVEAGFSLRRVADQYMELYQHYCS